MNYPNAGGFMDLLAELPVVGQWTVLGISFALNVYWIIQLLRGEMPTRRELDQVQRTSDMWQRAWEASQEVQVKNAVTMEQFTSLVARMHPLADTLEHVLESLPKPPEEGSQ